MLKPSALRQQRHKMLWYRKWENTEEACYKELTVILCAFHHTCHNTCDPLACLYPARIFCHFLCDTFNSIVSKAKTMSVVVFIRPPANILKTLLVSGKSFMPNLLNLIHKRIIFIPPQNLFSYLILKRPQVY